MSVRTIKLAVASFVFLAAPSAATPNDEHDTQIKSVSFDVSEGTWMSIDVSPDGETLVFDLLNDIYIMPASGGTALAIHDGSAAQRSPQFSPDGQSIVYLSDQSGADNVWTSKLDGTDTRQITRETHAMVAGPAWAPDGQSVAAVLTHSDIFRVRNSEIRRYALDGSLNELLVFPPRSGKDVQEPRFSPDGKHLYYTERIGGDHYVYMNTGLKNFAVKKLAVEGTHSHQKYKDGQRRSKKYDSEHERGHGRQFISGFGGATTPQISPNGESIAFIRRLGAKTVLFVKDIATGDERPVFENLGRDLQGDYLPQEHYYPSYDWFPDNRHVAIWAKGKLLKIDTIAATATDIPFTVTSRHEIQPPIRVRQNIAPKNVDVRTIRQLAPAPNSDTLIFRALGKLWQTRMSDINSAKRLTTSTTAESEAAWSPDGRLIAYVSWHDETGSRLIIHNHKTGAETILVKSRGIIRQPHFSNSGEKIAYRIMAPDTSMNAAGPEVGLYLIDALGGDPHYLSRSSGVAGFSADDKRIFHYDEPQYQKRRASVLVSIDIDGSNRREHAIAKTADVRSLSLSPDQNWLAFKYHNRPYVMPLDTHDETIIISPEVIATARRLSDIGGYEMSWMQDSSNILWTLGPDIFVSKPGDEGQPEKAFTVQITASADRPEGVVAFVGGKVIPIVGDVIENGTVIVEGNLIKAVGDRANIKIPDNAKRIDISGKTLMPGLFDAHGHIDCCFGASTMPQQQPTRYAALAYGVTTNFDPYSNDLMSYESGELTLTGALVGPRWLKSGQVIHGNKARTDGVYHPLASLKDARDVLKRRTALGPSILKSYKLSTRAQRQRLVEAAREYGYMVDAEGAGQFYTNIGMLLDGHTNLEHNLPVATYYDDLQQLIAATDVSMTPTLIVVFGELFGENFIYEHGEWWKEDKVRTFIPDVNNAYNPIAGAPGAPLQVRNMHSIKVTDDIYDIGFRSVGRSVTKLDKAGVTINVGSHGQASGLAMHWEMQLFAEGGMAPIDILRAATLNGAKTYGLDHQLGSIEPGKLADLIVLEKDPLKDIRHTNSVRYTMINGRLYDAFTMDEIGNYDRPRGKFYWETIPRNGIDWKSTWSDN